MSDKPVEHVAVKKVNAEQISDANDILATEEPMEIRLDYPEKGKRIQKSISVTMRTPGSDNELALGFLFTEGIIKSFADVVFVRRPNENIDNVVQVVLTNDVTPDVARLERNFYTSSSCGVCGKASIEAVFAACTILDTKDDLRFERTMIYRLPDVLRKHQEVFESTGGLHGCALFDTGGNLALTREDVGRHNALDKLIGAALTKGMLPLDKYLLLLSGRASFELMQKAAMAGIKIVAAVGAPSSLAVKMAEEWGMTLIGFLRGERFNIYSGAERIVI
jgi:FdhD protein